MDKENRAQGLTEGTLCPLGQGEKSGQVNEMVVPTWVPVGCATGPDGLGNVDHDVERIVGRENLWPFLGNKVRYSVQREFELIERAGQQSALA